MYTCEKRNLARLIILQNHCIVSFLFSVFEFASYSHKLSEFSLVTSPWNRQAVWFPAFASFMFLMPFLNFCVFHICTTFPPGISGFVERGWCKARCILFCFVSHCWVTSWGKLIAEGTRCFCRSFCSLTLVRRDVGGDEDRKKWETGVGKLLKVPGQFGGQWNIFGRNQLSKSFLRRTSFTPKICIMSTLGNRYTKGEKAS